MEGSVSVDATWWRSLSPDDRAYLLHRWGLPPLVMASLDKSTMTITMREPTADDLLAALGETDAA